MKRLRSIFGIFILFSFFGCVNEDRIIRLEKRISDLEEDITLLKELNEEHPLVVEKETLIDRLRSKWRLIRVGDSEDKVFNLLGEPDRVGRVGNVTLFSYEGGQINFSDGRVSEITEPDWNELIEN